MTRNSQDDASSLPKLSESFCRPAVRAEAETIRDFQLEMAMESEKLTLDGATCLLGVMAVFEDPARGRYFVVESAGHIVGSMLIQHEWSDWRNGTVWWIHSVYVIPAERGKGRYKALYAHVKSLVDGDPSLRGLRLYVDRTNVAAQKVYDKLGMSADHYLLYEWMKK
jgi:GNAT superfamily N-acetyltransferase